VVCPHSCTGLYRYGDKEALPYSPTIPRLVGKRRYFSGETPYLFSMPITKRQKQSGKNGGGEGKVFLSELIVN
jgi:hypothetical protein